MSEHVRVEQIGEVLSIILDRPERRNALTIDMYASFADAIERASGEPSIRIIRIGGEGRDFAAGNDLADFLDALPQTRGDMPVWRLLRALAGCETPILAEVHGNCVGIGTTMLLHCDLVVAEEGARFSMPFVDLGLVPEAASSLLLPRLAGRRRAARYLLLGEAFGTDEALLIGLVSEVAPQGQLKAAANDVIAELLAKPASALHATQKLLRHGSQDELLERMTLEGEIFAERLQSAEAKEAFMAFFEKRKPDFSRLS